MLNTFTLFLYYAQLYDRREKFLKYEAEKQAWRSIDPHYMSEESDEENLIVHSPSWRSTRKFNLQSIATLLCICNHLFHSCFAELSILIKNWTTGWKSITVVLSRASTAKQE